MGGAPAGWHPDPSQRHELRYWDGTAWTEHVSDRGIVGRDPLPSGPATVPADDRPAADASTDRTPVQRDAAEVAATRRGLVDAVVATSRGSRRLFLDEQALWWGEQCIPYRDITGLHWFVFLMRMTSGPTRVLSPEGHGGVPIYRLYIARAGGRALIEFQGHAFEIYESATAVLEELVGHRLVGEKLDRIAAGETVEVAGWELSPGGLRYGRRRAPWGEPFELEQLWSDAAYTAHAVAGSERRKVGKVRFYKEDGPLLPMLFARGAERFAPKPPAEPGAPAGGERGAASTPLAPSPADPGWPLELVYSVGNEHSPGSPTGRAVLTLVGGAARLDHHRAGGLHRRWTASVGADDRQRLRAALDTAGFPSHRPLELTVAGSTIRTLAVTGGAASGSVSLPFHETATMPGYAEAFTWLDTVVLLMTGGQVHDVASGADPVVVGDLRAVAAEPAEPAPGWRTEAAEAARAAAADLGIEAVSPVKIEVDGVMLRPMAHFPQFGGPLGMFVFAPSRTPAPAHVAALSGAGYGCTLVGMPVPYDRARLVRLLDRWAWVPTDRSPPDWYSGPSLDADDWAPRALLPDVLPTPRPAPPV